MDFGVRYVSTADYASDAADGLTRATPWATVEKLNTEIVSATRSWHAIFVDAPASAPLPLSSQLRLPLFHRGITLAGDENGNPAYMDAWKRYPVNTPGTFTRPNAGSYPNVWATPVADAVQAGAVLDEDDSPLSKVVAADEATAFPLVNASGASFYNAGAGRIIFHTSAGDPNSNGKRYERAYAYGTVDASHAVFVDCFDPHLLNLVVKGPHTTPPTSATGEFSDAYAVLVQPRGHVRVDNVWARRGTKHPFGFNNGSNGYAIEVTDSYADQATPWALAGGTTAWVVYVPGASVSGGTARFTRCGTRANTAAVGNPVGVNSIFANSFYSHDDGTPGGIDTIELTDCNFSRQIVGGGSNAKNGYIIRGGVYGDVASGLADIRDVTVDYRLPEPQAASGRVSVRDSILRPIVGSINGETAPGRGQIVYDHNLVDATGLVSSFYYSLFLRIARIDLTFTRNAVVVGTGTVGPVIGRDFDATQDRLQFAGNSYIGRSDALTMLDFKDAANATDNRTLPQFRDLGYDVGASDVVLFKGYRSVVDASNLPVVGSVQNDVGGKVLGTGGSEIQGVGAVVTGGGGVRQVRVVDRRVSVSE